MDTGTEHQIQLYRRYMIIQECMISIIHMLWVVNRDNPLPQNKIKERSESECYYGVTFRIEILIISKNKIVYLNLFYTELLNKRFY